MKLVSKRLIFTEDFNLSALRHFFHMKLIIKITKTLNLFTTCIPEIYTLHVKKKREKSSVRLIFCTESVFLKIFIIKLNGKLLILMECMSSTPYYLLANHNRRKTLKHFIHDEGLILCWCLTLYPISHISTYSAVLNSRERQDKYIELTLNLTTCVVLI